MHADYNSKLLLPNGLVIYHHNQYETDYVYQEIFVDHIYLQHGISINNNAIIFDIGANIGLFSLYIKMHYPSANIFAFEPSIDIYQLLQLNTISYDDIHHYNLGILDKVDIKDFYYYPKFSVLSGFEVNPNRATDIIFTSSKSGNKENDDQLNALIKQRLSSIVATPCQTTTISTMIQQQQISVIDLLKIDTEGSELAILNGVIKNDWPKIRQIVIEVHNNDDLAKIIDLLTMNSYHISIDPDKRLQQADIFNLYAIRKD